MGKFQLPDGREVWSMSSRKYCAAACKCTNEMLAKKRSKLQGQTDHPYPANYKPEVDTTEELGGELTSRYQQLIGILRWCVELRRIDIAFEVSKLSAFN
eukprot:8722693-Ditylum_brightwellii.AAC.3